MKPYHNIKDDPSQYLKSRSLVALHCPEYCDEGWVFAIWTGHEFDSSVDNGSLNEYIKGYMLIEDIKRNIS